MPSPSIRTEVTEVTIWRLARDIARDITPVPDLLKTYQLTLPQYDEIVGTKIFQNRLEEELAAWNTDGRARIAAKSMAIVEEGLLELFDLIHDRTQPMSSKIDALKFTAKLAALENGALQLNPEERIVFNITFGGNRHRFEDQRDNTAGGEAKVIDAEVTQLGKTP
jgi:hypothetical protein